MKKLLLCLFIVFTCCGFTPEEFDIDDFYEYEKEYKTEDVALCSTSSTKTYESYRAITNTASKQYQLLSAMTIDETTGFLYDEDGFIAVAMGSYFGPLGSRFYVTLDSGNVIPVIKADAKSDSHTVNGCAAEGEGSVIEFIIDEYVSRNYFGQGPSGLASYGNFNNDDHFRGRIVRIERVLDEKIEEGVVYELEEEQMPLMNLNDITY